MPNSDLEGKIAIVTGATSGIGKEITLNFVREGIHVIAVGSREEEKIPEELKIERDKGNVTYFQADISDIGQVEKLIDFSSQKFNGAHFLINFAGMFPMDFFTRIDMKSYVKDIEINLIGAIAAFWKWLKKFEERGAEKGYNAPEIAVFASSVSGMRPYGGNSVYESTKAGIRQFVLDQELEWEILKKRLEKGELQSEFSVYNGKIPRVAAVYPDNIATTMIVKTSGNLFADPKSYFYVPVNIVSDVVTNLIKGKGKYSEHNHVEVRILERGIDKATDELLEKAGKSGVYSVFYPKDKEGNLDVRNCSLEFLTEEVLTYDGKNFVRK